MPADAELARVRYVHDGDSLTLTDGRKLRLIGINAPELGRDGKPDQPLAIAARDHLRRHLFQHGNMVRVRGGRQAKDRYGRQLVHAFDAEGGNLARRQLRQGLAMALAVPPNLWGLHCHLAAEAAARAAQRGLWGHPHYAPKQSRDLGLRAEGFQLLRGTVVAVRNTAGATLVELEGRVALRIPAADLAYFPQPPSQWPGRRVEARGWFFARRGQLRAALRHPAMLKWLEAPVGERATP